MKNKGTVNKIQECGNFKKKKGWRDLFSKEFKVILCNPLLNLDCIYTIVYFKKKCSSSVINLYLMNF